MACAAWTGSRSKQPLWLTWICRSTWCASGIIADQRIPFKNTPWGFSGSFAFCTTSKEFTLESYAVNVDGYLLKPLLLGPVPPCDGSLSPPAGRETAKASAFCSYGRHKRDVFLTLSSYLMRFLPMEGAPDYMIPAVLQFCENLTVDAGEKTFRVSAAMEGTRDENPIL